MAKSKSITVAPATDWQSGSVPPIKSHRELAEALAAGFEKRMRERDFSEHTIRGYMFAVREFLNFLHSQSPVDGAHVRVRGYLAELMARGLSRPTISHRITVMREFFKYMNREGLTDRNPLLELPARRSYSRKLPRF